MKLFSFAIFFILLALSTGCNPNHPTPGAPSSYKVKQIIIDLQNLHDCIDTVSFTYDTLGRIVTVLGHCNGNSNENNTFSGSNMQMDNHWQSGAGDVYGTLNGQNLLISCTCDYRGVESNIYSRFTYDADGFLQEQRDSKDTEFVNKTFQWVDSCLYSIKTRTNIGLGYNDSVIYTYYVGQREYRDFGLETWVNYKADVVFSQALLVGTVRGRNSKYLVKTLTDKNGTINYSYTFDQYGRVATQTQTFTGGGSILTYTYY